MITINLPSSKSISNRLLLLEYLSKSSFNIRNLSTSSDTALLQSLLNQIKESKKQEHKLVELNCDNAGTVFRFILALLATENSGEWILDGNQRMRERPIAPLVDTLRRIGSDIEYLQKEGFPPLKIRSKPLDFERENNVWEIDSAISSQYVSALMLIAPRFTSGVNIRLVGKEMVSMPYIQMTAQILRDCGVNVEFIDSRNIFVCGNIYRPIYKYVEADWSSASYFFEHFACRPDIDSLLLLGLKENTLQGDKIILDWFEKFGIEADFEEKGLRLTRGQNFLRDGRTETQSERNARSEACAASRSPETPARSEKISLDFTHHPDMFATMAVLCAAMRLEASFTGIENLKHKECDRLSVVLEELAAMGLKYTLDTTKSGSRVLSFHGSKLTLPKSIKTHGDHRIAMAFSIFAKEVEIEYKEVVGKSFENFWEELENLDIK